MAIKKNEGFTLIEIIVSLMIVSIAMVIATSLILNSMGYFNKTAISDNDKQILDGVRDYIQTELIYASEVRISESYPVKEDGTIDEGWHYLFVKDNALYKDNDCETDFTKANKVYGDDFYNRRKLFIDARGFDEYRVDFNLYLTSQSGQVSDYNNKYVYKTSTTIELLNMKNYITHKGGTSFLKQSSYSKLENSSTYTGYKVFYKKDDLTMSSPVGDTIACKNEKNSKGEWKADTEYKPGEFVEYPSNSEKWYVALYKTTKGDRPDINTSGSWKNALLEWHPASSYLKDDIVTYNGKYYQCRDDYRYDWTFGSGKTMPGVGNLWGILADKENLPQQKCIVVPSGDKTVGGEKDRCPGAEKEWKSGEVYNPGDYVKMIENGEVVWYRYVKNESQTYEMMMETSEPGNVVGSNIPWKRIDMNWNTQSLYFIGDIVLFDKVYYKAKINYVHGAWNPTVQTAWDEIGDSLDEETEPRCIIYKEEGS